jgi:hypothetical protein
MNAGQPWEETCSRGTTERKRIDTGREFKVELPDLFTLCFMHECGVYLG